MRITKAVDRWFDIPGDPDKGRLLIHNLSPEELDEINDKAFIQDINYKKVKGKKEKFEPTFTSKTDKKAFRELPIQKAVIGWENFFDEGGKTPIKCTPENVLKAARTIDGFSELVAELREQLAADIAQEKEDQRKN